MTKSETISELAKALSKAQATIEVAAKDSENPFYKSTYADLSSVWEAARKPLTDNGLSISQLPGECDGKKIRISTLLMHASGEWLMSEFDMPYLKDDPQAVGSAITYARRYALAAIVGIVADEDDDGNKAADKEKDKQNKGKEDKKAGQPPPPKSDNKITPAPKEKRNKLHDELEAYCQLDDGTIDREMYLTVLKEISKFESNGKERFITDIFADKSDQGQTISEKWVNSCIGKLRERTGGKKEAA